MKEETGELHAPPEADADNVQAFTSCFAVDYIAGGMMSLGNPEDMIFGVTLFFI